MRRAQTGHISVVGNQALPDQRHIPIPMDGAKGEDFSSSGFLRAEPSNPSSFAARVQAEMRAGEGHALSNGFKTPSPESTDVAVQSISRSGSGASGPVPSRQFSHEGITEFS